MMKTRKTLSSDERYKLTQEFKSYHNYKFEELGVHNPFFVIKQAYVPFELHSNHIHLFESELRKGCDIYVEIVNSNYEPASSSRELFRWSYNPNWSEEYHKAEIKGSTRIFIPCDELVLVNVGRGEESEFLEDAPISQLTIKDIYAIFTGDPVSDKKWLNKLINKHGR